MLTLHSKRISRRYWYRDAWNVTSVPMRKTAWTSRDWTQPRPAEENGPALVPGDLNASRLWTRIEADEMPPDNPLSDGDKALVREWIASGGAWTIDQLDPFQFTTDARAGYDWWALQPLTAYPVPSLYSAGWVRNDIDRFVHRRLREAEIEPSRQASPRALVRRLYFDLIGLPPHPSIVQEFENDPSDRAYEAIVDRLLASPGYGERWGRHWLDLARFGESDGFERNNPRENLWPYRDWVIKALNDDLPYDQFVRMQLAGDLVDPGPDGVAATGFVVAGVHNTVVGSSQRMKRLARQDELEEMIGTIGQTFLGLTINCARCHDHKYDPIPTREYYQMIAAIDGVRHGEREVADETVAEELKEAKEEQLVYREELTHLDQSIRDLIRARRALDEALSPRDEPPAPIAHWEFDEDLSDSIGGLDGELHGQAKPARRCFGGRWERRLCLITTDSSRHRCQDAYGLGPVGRFATARRRSNQYPIP